jgi:hypothetical protein
MKKFIVGCLGFVCLLSAQQVQAAPIAVINGSGLYTGFTGLDVGGTLYDVNFVEGTMLSLFGNPVVSYFATSAADAAASTALYSAIGATPALDGSPNLTFGCSADSPLACFIWTTYTADAQGFNVIELRNGQESQNVQNGLNDIIVANNLDTTTLSAFPSGGGFVYADWSLSGTTDPNPTPEPATLTLIGLGLAGMVGKARQRRNAK